MHRRPDLVGNRYGRLLVLSVDKDNQKRDSRWICECSCGTKLSVLAMSLKRGSTKSCGCLRDELAAVRAQTHGQTRSPEYYSWQSMRQRCNKPNHVAYSSYGGRGISVCERWQNSFENFIADLGPRPAGFTLDRINNNDGYTPENTRWATGATQNRNRRDNHFLIINGVEKILADWAEDSGLPPDVVSKRLKAGWSPIDAISKPRRVLKRPSVGNI